MTPSSPTHRPLLRAVAGALVASAELIDELAPAAIGLAGPDRDTVELALQPLPTTEPLDAVVGFTAPSTWQGFGVVAPATAHEVTDDSLRPSGRHHRTMLVHLVPRRGRAMSLITEADGCPRELTPAPEHQPAGRLDDVCRRALGRPTPPQPGGTHPIADALYLDRVFRHVLDDGRLNLDDRALERLHPLHTPDDDTGAASGLRSDDDPLERAVVACAQLGWPGRWGPVRRALCHREVSVPWVHPDDADWFDDGALGRWILAEFPLPHRAVDDLEVLLTPSQLAAVLRPCTTGLQLW